MRSFIQIITLMVLCALTGVGAGTSAQGGDGVRRITPEEARKALDAGQAIIIDVRDETSYKAGHAKGARWIPVNDIASRASELPRDKMIITYCS
ncbi:MAG TPA: rhodanese-like domain-containing protein [Pyrinomonadaceae bacterium]|nr:rhodanese-like domain-containing protein [Pyrinomonadaceae bacterium]